MTDQERAALSGIVSKFTEEDRESQELNHNAYFAEGGFKSGAYLWKHIRESADGYSARVKRREYRNFFRQVLDASVRPVFSKAPDRRVEAPLFAEFVKDADGSGNTLDQIIQSATITASLQGAAVLVMDAPETPADTLGGAIAARSFPYVFTISPREISEFAFDAFGALSYLRYLEAEIQSWKRWRVYLRVGGLNLTWTEDSSGTESARREVPVFPYLYRVGEKPERKAWPVSPWGPLAESALVVYNLVSLALTQEIQSTFNILTIQGTQGAKDLTLGENSVLYYGQGMERPAFIAPDTSTLKIILGHLEAQKAYIYQVANQALAISTAQASGESRKWADRLRQEQLAGLLRQVSALDNWISSAFHLWTKSAAEWSVRYSSSFEYLSLSEDLKDAASLLDLGISPENARRVRQDALLRKFSDADTAVREEIAAAEEALVDYPGGGPDGSGNGNEDSDQDGA